MASRLGDHCAHAETEDELVHRLAAGTLGRVSVLSSKPELSAHVLPQDAGTGMIRAWIWVGHESCSIFPEIAFGT